MKKDIVDTTTTHRYIEYRPKEERERKYAELKAEAAQLPHGSHRFRQVAADLEAGSAVITHQESKMTQKWKEFKETNSVFQGLLRARRSVEESENPMIERVRDFFSSAMQETEEAQVIRYIHSVDPTFTIDKFMCDATEFYIPEIMEAYLRGDEPILKEWCSEPVKDIRKSNAENKSDRDERGASGVFCVLKRAWS